MSEKKEGKKFAYLRLFSSCSALFPVHVHDPKVKGKTDQIPILHFIYFNILDKSSEKSKSFTGQSESVASCSF